MAPKVYRTGFPTYHFVCKYKHNLKTKGHIRMFYLLNDCSTIKDIYSLGQSCMWDTIDELWIKTCIPTIFLYNILWMLILVTWKPQVVCRCSTYWTTALLSEMSIFCVRAGCEKRMVSYASKDASQSLSNKPFVHIPLYLEACITWKLQLICERSTYRTTAMLSGTFFVCFRVAWEIQLKSYGPRHASVVLWYSIVCA